jgi:hypothetical protein
MKIKIIASKPINRDVVGIENHIGEIFDAYEMGEYVVIRNHVGCDWVVYKGEYEVIEH